MPLRSWRISRRGSANHSEHDTNWRKPFCSSVWSSSSVGCRNRSMISTGTALTLARALHELQSFVFQVRRRSGLLGPVELFLANEQNSGSRSLEHLLLHQPIRHLLSLLDLSTFLQALSVFLLTEQRSEGTKLDQIEKPTSSTRSHSQRPPPSTSFLDEQLRHQCLLRVESDEDQQRRRSRSGSLNERQPHVRYSSPAIRWGSMYFSLSCFFCL